MAWANTVTAGTSWQELAVAVEIAEAYNKRAAACGAATITADETVTVFDFVKAVQDGIEAMVTAVQTVNVYATTAWADPDAAVEGAAAYPARFATVADFFAVCGLTGSGGWRRIGAGGTQPAAWTDYADAGWSYGGITDGDLAGPWWWIDLQKALEKITRWTKKTMYVESDLVLHTARGDTPAELAAAPVWTTTPFTGTAPSSQIAAQKTRTAYELVEVAQSNYMTYTISGLTDQNKNVKLTVILSRVQDAFEDFGLGYEAGVTKAVRSWTEDAATSFTGEDMPIITSYSALLAYVPDPAVGQTIVYGMQTGSGESFYKFWVVDYLFDP